MSVKAGAPSAPSPSKPLSRLFGKLLGKPPAGDGDLGAPAAPATPAVPERTVRFSGRIMTRQGKAMAASIAVTSDLQWDPGAEVELVWADRRRARARVVGGTRPATVQAGHLIRIVVELDETQDPPVEMIITIAGAEITVALST
jgi:hypothetical protein